MAPQVYDARFCLKLIEAIENRASAFLERWKQLLLRYYDQRKYTPGPPTIDFAAELASQASELKALIEKFDQAKDKLVWHCSFIDRSVTEIGWRLIALQKARRRADIAIRRASGETDEPTDMARFRDGMESYVAALKEVVSAARKSIVKLTSLSRIYVLLPSKLDATVPKSAAARESVRRAAQRYIRDVCDGLEKYKRSPSVAATAKLQEAGRVGYHKLFGSLDDLAKAMREENVAFVRGELTAGKLRKMLKFLYDVHYENLLVNAIKDGNSSLKEHIKTLERICFTLQDLA